MTLNISTIDDFDIDGKAVLLRVDINSPIDRVTQKIVNQNRINKSIPTIRDLSDKGARLVIIAHQGDTLDYQNLISLTEHAKILSKKLKRPVQFVDDVAGPTARKAIKALKSGRILLLDNLRYLTEEVSTFENDVKLSTMEMTRTYLVQSLYPLFDYYVNDAFAAAHRNAPSMVAFQELLPSAAGRLLTEELTAISGVVKTPARPCVFLLGGLKISDAFGMMEQVLSSGVADTILTTGITGHVMLMAQGIHLGKPSEKFIKDRSLDKFIAPAQGLLSRFPNQLYVPEDLAMEIKGERTEILTADLPAKKILIDIGEKTITKYETILNRAGTVFVNGPAGVCEMHTGAKGTRRLWERLVKSNAFSVIGGGDTVTCADRFIDTRQIGFVCTGGGALIRYMSGKKLPLITAMEKAYRRKQSNFQQP
ncbi:MAG: phosphoglycerate kinase [Desulfobacula sp.]|uniref:phosphoglycerate kinase n=1 Tax=Desulfobacula sp. TaxID=2593537 RepID=UPI0025BD8784|nr:phosphoglycerate kinase [Desulfobacula sp.]MCD4719186.1 phosphoglycerate kinase [Desulfobacula sp.]